MGFLNTIKRAVMWWDSQTIGTQLFTARNGVKVGEDAAGNQFYETKDEIGAARIYYRQIAAEYQDTPFANRAFARLNDLKNRPAKPGQPVKWLVDLFPEDDPVKPLIATESDGLLR